MIKPLNERVLIEVDEQEEQQVGGIVLAASAQEKPQTGKVVAVAPETEDFKPQVKEGDKVLFEKYAGSEIKHDGEAYLIVKEKDIVAIID